MDAFLSFSSTTMSERLPEHAGETVTEASATQPNGQVNAMVATNAVDLKTLILLRRDQRNFTTRVPAYTPDPNLARFIADSRDEDNDGPLPEHAQAGTTSYAPPPMDDAQRALIRRMAADGKDD
jgi:hypothetical protein